MTTLAQHLDAHQYTDTCDGWESCDCGWREEQERRSESGSVFTHAEHVAATWQQARTITTIDQLDALPRDTVLRLRDGEICMVGGEGCDPETRETQYFGWTDCCSIPERNLPATVLWTPADGGDQ